MTDRIVDGFSFAGQPYIPFKASAYVSADQTIGDAAFSTVNFDTTSYDTSSDVGVSVGFDTTNHQYLVPVTAYYHVKARVNVNTPANASVVQTFFISAFINGVETRRGQGGLYPQPNPGGVQNLSSTMSADLRLIKGDIVTIKGFPSMGGGNSTVKASSISNYFDIHFLSV